MKDDIYFFKIYKILENYGSLGEFNLKMKEDYGR
jgi:hypothetical protein